MATKERSVSRVPALPVLPKNLRVGIYCRVNSTHADQLDSLAQQASTLTRLVMSRWDWRLTDIYLEIKSGTSGSARPEYERLVGDCRNGYLDLVITKSISRFGRDTLELVARIRELKDLGVSVMFENESINTKDADAENIITIIEASAQAESEAKSANTRWGLERRATDSNFGLYKRRCYGYTTDDDGNLHINPEEATVVEQIFDLYLSGHSLVSIIRTLEELGIKTPTGKPRWSKNALDKLLSNQKYVGRAEIFKTFSTRLIDPVAPAKRKANKGEFSKCIIMESHPAIISAELFDALQTEKTRRTNITTTADGTKRAGTRYSAKRDAPNRTQ